MNVVLKQNLKTDKKKLKKLYISAFPAEERAPFFLMYLKAKKGCAEWLSAYTDGEFAGFVYNVYNDEAVYLFYLAVSEEKRGKGTGTQIVEAVKEKYNGRKIFLAREQLDEKAENYGQRVKRREFYIRCGLTDMPCRIKEASMIYDVMGTGGTVTANDYDSLMTAWSGRLVRKFVDMRLIEEE